MAPKSSCFRNLHFDDLKQTSWVRPPYKFWSTWGAAWLGRFGGALLDPKAGHKKLSFQVSYWNNDQKRVSKLISKIDPKTEGFGE